MDERRFGAALRALDAGATRRQGLAAALGVLMGGGAVAAVADEAAARPPMPKGGPWPAGPCGPTGRENRCSKDNECCTGHCKPGKKGQPGRCRCIKPNKPCKKSQLCCGGRTCEDGICTTAQPAPQWVNQTTFGTQGSGSGNFNVPWGIWVSPDELTMWVVDSSNNRIVIWTRPDATSTNWAYSTEFGSGPNSGDSEFNAPAGIYVSEDTLTAWIADSNNNRVVIWTRPNASSTAWSFSAKFGTGPSNGDSDFDQPWGVWVSPDELTAWIADSNNSRVMIWTRPNAASTVWSYSAKFVSPLSGDAVFDRPASVVVSPDTLTAWVADQSYDQIVIWNRPNTASTTWSFNAKFGTDGSGDNELVDPFGVFVSPDLLTTYVSDYNNNRFVIWTRPDTSSTTWSYSTQFGSGPASGPSNFANLTGIHVSADGLTAWIADTDNNRISIWHRV